MAFVLYSLVKVGIILLAESEDSCHLEFLCYFALQNNLSNFMLSLFGILIDLCYLNHLYLLIDLLSRLSFCALLGLIALCLYF